ncbi:hypothetical protein UFOVP1357_21 [uncultured Caudovirales phage]|uniref:Uncharacterized protein n=1 Tax=uncultured Caudovirales phage TaxID=2100421 RepID=A0A6J5LLP7_9CAUD|nr:hypothetical protein UFOVP18_52 [uncultured Caudovirales phage]CAB4127103.1 hypothetical protein UFOVP82_54 [uncultured Caudovirales phage]CAB4132649.1 hypothetical protein UFOVP258_45 [uncultured Caudovirales phage]CAB4146539.1 hypothetical protein UFOVP502_37 [uncultured Caudovirales phage]CAB4199946.1 hypothetical protein UFOVP1357_21 [uncultured Caudovirales phage]
MAYTNRVAWENLRSLDASTLTSSYQAVGVPLLFPSYILKMVNTSTSNVLISIDGTNNVDVCPGGGFWLYDEYKSMGREFVSAHSKIFVKLETGAAASAGFIYVVSQYLVAG